MATALNAYQPALVLTEALTTEGIFPSRDSYNDGMTIAMAHVYAFNFGLAAAPAMNGQLLQIAQNTALFSLLGTLYGGNGVNTFALPDLGARAAIGDGQGPGLSPVGIGEQIGAASALLTQPQLPPSLGGQSQPALEDQPSLGMRYLIRTEGIYPSQGGLGAMPLNTLGTIVKFAGNFTPGGYQECAGQLLDIAANDTLFSLIGTTYGGDGATTFALPDLRGRAIVGAGGAYQIAESFGQQSVFLTQANLPTNMGGAGAPIDNREPSLALNYIIALNGIFPNRDGGADPYEPFIGEVMAFAGGFAPSGWALCQGQLLPINQNQALFSLLGTQYGGDGRATFALPDLRGRSVLGSGPSTSVGQVLGADQIVLGSANFPDLVYSGANTDGTHYGGDGSDTIDGLGGNDILVGNSGNDTLNGGGGNDTLRGDNNNDRLDGGAGLDTGDFSAATGPVTVDLNLTGAQNTGQGMDTLVGVENLVGAGFADRLTGNNLDNQLFGGAGNDTLAGGLGADRFDGGLGTDTADFSAALYGVYVNLAVATAQNTSQGLDTFVGIDNLLGSAHADTLLGNGLANVLTGAGGNDTLRGEAGLDSLYGGAGNDRLFGGGEADLLDGGTGNDRLDGGLGADRLYANYAADTFVFTNNTTTGSDRCFNFVTGVTKLEFDISAFGGTIGAFAFHANANPNPSSGLQAFLYDQDNGYLYLDRDGTGAAGRVLACQLIYPGGGVPTLVAGDILLV